MTSKISSWSQVQLGEVLKYTDQLVELDNETEYTTITVKRRHGGLEARENLFGSQIRTKKQFKLLSGAFIISRVQCWHQAYAIVPDTIEPNMIASTNYDQFIISPQVDKRFFWWLSYSPIFTGIVRSCAFGVVIEKMVFNRDTWLDKTISLPPLSEQQRIVARIEELAARIEEARGLRREGVEEAEVLMNTVTRSMFEELENRSATSPLKRSTRILGGGTPSKANYGFWQGTIPWVSPKDMKVRNLYDSEDHISELALQSGASVLIPKDSVLIVVRSGILRRKLPISINRVPVTINQDMKALIPSDDILCDFLAWWFKDKESKFLETVKEGTTVQSIIWDRASEFNICIPPLDEQRRIVAYLDDLQSKVDTLEQLQSEISAELDALLPSILDKAFKGEL